MTDKLYPIVGDMVREAEKHADANSADRIRAMEYYRGEMKDTPSEDGRSSLVSRDIRKHIKKVLPSIMRTIFGADEVVEFQPAGEGDEGGAEQSSDYINYVVMNECGARKATYDAIHDALLLRNGILKWWSEEKQTVKYSHHSGLTEEELVALLTKEPNAEIVERSEEVENIDGEDITTHRVKLRRTETKPVPRVAAVPRERFLIHPDATSMQDSLLTGERSEVRRSDLVAMGYDKKLVDELSIAGNDDEDAERRDNAEEADEAQGANELIDYYEIYVRIDQDGDGIAELRRMCFAGGLCEKNLLENDEVDEVQFADIAAMRQPHQWEGISLADDLYDIQQPKTVLLRSTADNVYWQNDPQPIIQEGVVEEDGVFNPDFGKPIVVKKGYDVRQALGFTQVPFVANHSFDLMSALDEEGSDRTGVTDASSGMAPDALQNMTAKASAMIEQAGIGQTEMMVRTIADGLEVFFKGLLRLIIRHQDKPRTVRLRDEWVEVDPRHWNADMDVNVNTGLGAGTRERDMMMMQYVMNTQEKLIAAFGPDNPYVSPENLSNAINKMTESAGLRTPRMYFTTPDPDEVKAKLAAQAQQPDPEQMKMQAEMQLEQTKMQMNMKMEDKRMQAARDKEMAQMEADLQVKSAEIEASSRAQSERLVADAAMKDKDIAWEREKLDRQEAFEREKLAVQWTQDNKPEPVGATQ